MTIINAFNSVVGFCQAERSLLVKTLLHIIAIALKVSNNWNVSFMKVYSV